MRHSSSKKIRDADFAVRLRERLLVEDLTSYEQNIPEIDEDLFELPGMDDVISDIKKGRDNLPDYRVSSQSGNPLLD